jgi:hypothetical protein
MTANEKKDLSSLVALRRENIELTNVVTRYGKMMRELDVLLVEIHPDVNSIRKIVYKAQLDVLDL